MSTPEFQVVGVFVNALDAQQLKNLLEAQGIVAYLDGSHVATTLSHIGSALGGVKVLVTPADADRALKTIQEINQLDQQSGPWTCPQCHEQLEASFDLCWRCGQPRQDTP